METNVTSNNSGKLEVTEYKAPKLSKFIKITLVAFFLLHNAMHSAVMRLQVMCLSVCLSVHLLR